MRRIVPVLLTLAALAAVRGRAEADAIIVTQAMKAATIAEVFIEETQVRIELEIGMQDLNAFRNLLADGIYERLELEPKPLAERLPLFTQEDWVVKADGRQLEGRVSNVLGRRRVVRDPITGDPVPGQEEAGDPVIAARVVYPFEGRPAAISLRPPLSKEAPWASAEIGFTTYHLGLPAMDFRYLGGEETIDLDWDDPWYSKFRNRNLRRQYDAPLNLFLYVDPFEVRKEIVLRPQDLQSFVDLGLEGKDVIDVASQAELKNRVAQFLAREAKAVIDGKAVDLTLDRIHFVQRTLRKTGVVDPPEPLPTVSATLGVIFVVPLEAGWPKRVETSWGLWNDRIQMVPAIATDEAGGLPTRLTPEDPALVWENFLTNPRGTGLVAVPPPPPAVQFGIPLLSLAFAILALVLLRKFLRATDAKGIYAASMAVVALGGIMLMPYGVLNIPDPFGEASTVDDAEAGQVTSALLRNVYRAFDHRGESAIYDTLEKSVAGDLLQRVYLETRQSLELENQGGARVKVTDVEMLDATAVPLGDGAGFLATCTWNVSGSVGHWGHIHQRINQYQARLTVEAQDGAWKIMDVELLSEERL